MGWFLTRKKKGRAAKSAPKRSSSSASPRAWNPQRTLAGIKVVGVITGIGLAIMVWQRGDRALQAYVDDSRAAPVTPEKVVLADAPIWMTPAVRHELAATVAEQVAAQPLKNTLPAAVSALRKQPWVAGVERVYRRGDGVVEVYADYRQPLAIVEGKDGYHLVDAQGVSLPNLYTWEQAEMLGLPVIVGVATAPPATGERWPGEQVAAALSLVQLLSSEPYFEQIKAFNVADKDPRGRLRLTLHTEKGIVVWGLPPGQEQSVEQDSRIKLGWLRRINESRGSIDAGGKVVEIYGASIQLSQPGVEPAPAGTASGMNDAPVTTAEYQ